MSKEYERELTIEELNTLMGKNVGKELSVEEKKRALCESKGACPYCKGRGKIDVTGWTYTKCTGCQSTGKVYRFPMLRIPGFGDYTISDRVEDWLEAGRSAKGRRLFVNSTFGKGWEVKIGSGAPFLRESLIDAIAEALYMVMKEEL